jgi:23S rRNA pseudouridine2605 synthase
MVGILPPVRLARYLAHCGVASRRHAERLVTSGRVSVDGERVVDPARDVDEGSDVAVDGRAVAPEDHEYHVLNKPVGVVSTAHDPEGRPKVVDMVPSSARLYPVGRLDVDSSGLILLTNDGDLANRLTHPSFEVDKAYRARVVGSPSRDSLRSLRSGVELEDGLTAPANVRVLAEEARWTELEIVIHEGRKRQLRRMFEAVGHAVLALERVRFGPLDLDDLRPGQHRRLGEEEVGRLRGTLVGTIPAMASAQESQRDGDRLHALRGAISVERNDAEAILGATSELMSELMSRNRLDPAQMVSCIFSATADLDAQFPAVAARDLGLNKVALLCTQEIEVPGALPRVIRVLLHYYAPDGHEAQHVYLGEARKLREDLDSAQ